MMVKRIRNVEIPCKWYVEEGVRYLVPGCRSRALYGDDADCHCYTTIDPETDSDFDDDIVFRVEELEKRIHDIEVKHSTMPVESDVK